MTPPSPTPLTLSPPPARWREALTSFKPLSDTQRRFRAQLSLPTDRPIVMSGHQAQFWHPGIVAKLLAMDAAARSSLTSGGTTPATAWIVPDQDLAEQPLIRFPARDAADTLTTADWLQADPKPSLRPSSAEGSDPSHRVPPFDIPAASLPALTSISPLPPATTAISSIADGLARIRASLEQHAGQSTFARQVTSAALDLTSDLVPRPAVIFASDLSKTDLFRAIVDRARADPATCTRTYNDAVARTPHAHLRPLATDNPLGPELPFWRLTPNRPRTPVFASQLAEIPLDQLAPRALLLTGLIRLAACEIFIHGTGGAEYDPASEAWLRAWLADDATANAGLTPISTDTFALSTIATATLLLPLGVDPITPDDIARARWLSHHARHNPADLGDAAAHSAKQRHLAALRAEPRQSHARAGAFRSMHEALDAARRAHTDQLAGLDARAADILARSEQGRIAADRTWPFPLYPVSQLRELKRSIDAAFGL